MKKRNSIKSMIDHFLDMFPQITKDESNFTAEIIKWDDEKKAAFLFAKQIFEENECENDRR